MAEQRELKQAQVAFATLCEMLNENGWKYDANPEKLAVSCGVRGDDLPIELVIDVNADRQLVTLMSKLPYAIPEDKRVDVAVAISAINYAMVDGSFDYNFLTGSIIFRMTTSFKGSLISKKVYEYMVFLSCKMVDDYNDKILMFSKDKLSLEDLLKFINE